MTEFKLPELSEGIDSADVTQVLVSEGDTIAADQAVLEMETAKATFELPCPEAGRVAKIHVKKGDTIKVGQTILSLEAAEPGADGDEAPSKKQRAKPARQPESEKKTDDAREDGSQARAKEESAEQTDRPAKKPQPDRAAQQVIRDEPAGERGSRPPDAEPETRPQAAPEPDGWSESDVPLPAGPATRRLARELGVDLREVTGSGPSERITPEDVKAFVRERLKGTRADARAAEERVEPRELGVPPLPDFNQWGPTERQPLGRIGRTTADHLSLAWRLIPHVTQHELADITEFEAARKRFQSREAMPKITVTPLALKAVVTALKQFPKFNSSLDALAGEVILKQYYHIGVAVDTEHGLLVPVIRDVDQKSVIELAEELAEVAEKARQRKLGLDDFQGGTFTITNLGGIGGTAFTPIVNYPEVAILGMARGRWEQVIQDRQPVLRFMLPLALSYDHRVINGADGARFVGLVARLLSDPFELLLTS